MRIGQNKERETLTTFINLFRSYKSRTKIDPCHFLLGNKKCKKIVYQMSSKGFDRCLQVFELVVSPSDGIAKIHLIQLDQGLIMRPSNDQGMVNLQLEGVSL